jgi:hypothetical protein
MMSRVSTEPERVPENRSLREVKARLAEEEARAAARRAAGRRFATAAYISGEVAGVVALGLVAGVVALLALGSSSPWLWVLAGVLALACAIDGWVVVRRGDRT